MPISKSLDSLINNACIAWSIYMVGGEVNHKNANQARHLETKLRDACSALEDKNSAYVINYASLKAELEAINKQEPAGYIYYSEGRIQDAYGIRFDKETAEYFFKRCFCRDDGKPVHPDAKLIPLFTLPPDFQALLDAEYNKGVDELADKVCADKELNLSPWSQVSIMAQIAKPLKR